MKWTWVDGNVLVKYYPLDSDSLMIGLLHAESAELKLYMGPEKLDKIWMPASEGKLHPLALVQPNERYLPNFQWFDYIRPTSKEDIFIWRPKKKGTELKPSVRHEAPKKGRNKKKDL
jgi:hypothetical protein